MKNVFRIEYDKARDRCKLLCDIADPKGRDIFKSVFEECTNDLNKASCRAEEANGDEGRLGTTVQQHNAAYTFLALAFVALEEGIEIPIPGKSVKHHEFFHFAGHAFRVIGQLNRAADAYWRAGVTSGGEEDHYPDSFGIRSLAQAKIRFEDTGKVKKSDEMHCLEWEARRNSSVRCQKSILFLWGLTSKYGTSSRSWLWSLGKAIVSFTIVYECMHQLSWIGKGQDWTHVVSPLYYCFVTMTTLGYSEFASNHIAAQSVIVVNVIVGYFLLAVGASILGRKVIGR